MFNAFEGSFYIHKYCHKENKSFVSDLTTHFRLRYVEKGKLIAKCRNRTITVSPGEILYVPVEQLAEINVIAEPVCYGFVAKFRYWPNVDELDYMPQSIKPDDTLKSMVKTMPTIKFSGISVQSIWQFYKFLDVLQPLMVKNTDKRAPKISKALQYMRENDKYTIPEVAEYCGMSVNRFYVAFNDFFGMTPIKMKQKFQATKAEVLLKTTDLSVEEIAKQVGFASDTHFRKVFKSRYTISPKEIRKISKKDLML